MDEELHEANLVRYFGEDHETRIAIVRALAWLPADVRSFAVNECVFTSVGNSTHSVCLDRRLVGEERWIIARTIAFPQLKSRLW